MDEENRGKKNVSLTKDVIIVDVEPRVHEMMENSHRTTLAMMWEMTPNMLGLLNLAENMTLSFGYTCQSLFLIRRDQMNFRFVKSE